MLLVVSLLVAGSGAETTAPRGPAEAIALADAHPERGTRGIYQMKVARAERGPNALYLNSSSDYRAADDVTFHLTPSAAHTLEKRLGAKPETVLVGRTVIVRGEIRAIPIVNLQNGRPRSFNRFQHTVLVREAADLTVE